MYQKCHGFVKGAVNAIKKARYRLPSGSGLASAACAEKRRFEERAQIVCRSIWAPPRCASSQLPGFSTTAAGGFGLSAVQHESGLRARGVSVTRVTSPVPVSVRSARRPGVKCGWEKKGPDTFCRLVRARRYERAPWPLRSEPELAQASRCLVGKGERNQVERGVFPGFVSAENRVA